MRAYRRSRSFLRLISAGVLCLLAASPARAQLSSNSRVNVVVNGAVNATARIGNTLYIGGGFNRIAPADKALGSLVAVNPTTGKVIPNRLPLVIGGDVLAVVPDGSGGYYIGGGFDRIGADRQPNLRHLDASGQLISAFVGTPSAIVRAGVLAGGHLWVGGDFGSVGGTARQRLAALDPVTGAARGFATDASGPVTALAVSGTRLIVGGNFTQVGGQPRNRLAAFDAATGALLPWNPGADLQVSTIAADATTVYVGGPFTTVGGVARARLAAIDAATGATVTAFAPPAMTNTVNKLLLSGGMLYAGGNFQIGGQTPRFNAAAFDAATGAVLPWNPSPSSGVLSLAASGNLIYLGGVFLQVGGRAHSSVAVVDATTGAVASWDPDLVRSPNALAVADDGTVIAAGAMNATGGALRFNLAAIDLVTGALLPWAPSTNSAVLAMIADPGGDDGIAIGGQFTTVNGQPRNRLAAIDGTSGDVDDWNPGADNTVMSVVVANGQAYIGGSFSSVAGQPRSRLASFSVEDGELTTWAPTVTAGANQASVLALAAGDGVIYAGGSFTAINGAVRTSLAAIDANTGAATAFNANLPDPSSVNVLARSGPSVFVGGDAAVGLRVLDAASGAPTGQALPTLQPAAPIRALAIQSNTLYVGGGLFNLGPAIRRGLGGIDLSQAAPTTWAPDAGYNVNAVYAFPDIVVAVGNFSRANPVPASGLGVWERTSGAPAPPQSFQAGAIDNLASLQWTAPSLGPAATGYTLEVGSTPTSGYDLLTLPLGNVTSLNASAPTGTYYVRVRATNASGQGDPTPTMRIDAGCTAPPGPPGYFSAFVNGNDVSLEWDRASGNVARYILEAGTASGLSNIVTMTLAPQTTTLSAAAPPGTYFLRVKAANACGAGAASSEVFIVVGGAAALPGSPATLTATVSGSSVSFAWTAPTAGGAPTGYILEAGSKDGLADLARLTLPGSGTTFSTGPGVPPGTYYVHVRAVNAAGIGPVGAGVKVVVSP